MIVTGSTTRTGLRLGAALGVLATLVIVGGLLDGRRWARRGEVVRLSILLGVAAVALTR